MSLVYNLKFCHSYCEKDSHAETLIFQESTQAQVYLPYTELAKLPGARLNNRAWDLLRIAAAVYLADRLCRRGRIQEWFREIHLDISVSDISFWLSVSESLHTLLHDLSGDHWQITFHGSDSSKQPAWAPDRTSHAYDCVAMLSGGLDSFAGAVKLLEEGRTPLFLRHYTVNAQHSNHVYRALQKRYPYSKPAYQSLRLNWQRGYSQTLLKCASLEPSQRTRGLLFLVLGALSAAKLNVGDLYFNENGLFSYHLPLTLARSSSFSTRASRPEWLSTVQQLLNKILSHKALKIHNNMLKFTKVQVVRHLVERGFSPTIPKTATCFSSPEHSGKHCGVCLPCLHRYIAEALNGILDRRFYKTDPWQGFISLGEIERAQIIDLVRFGLDCYNMEEEVFCIKHTSVGLQENSLKDLKQTYSLYKRFGREMIRFCSKFAPDIPVTVQANNAEFGVKNVEFTEFLPILRDVSRYAKVRLSPTCEVHALKATTPWLFMQQKRLLRGETHLNLVKEKFAALTLKCMQRCLDEGGNTLRVRHFSPFRELLE